MSEPEPREEKTHARYWWLFLFMLVVTAGVAIAVLSMKKSVAPAHITLISDTNGNTRLFGVPLLTTNIRDKTFSAMSAMGVKASLVVPPGADTNLQERDKIIDTLQSMSRAGLFKTNGTPNPSPFE